ncbi:MAG: TetR/AcrR family transcriptional regulator [Myxococcota bacterium]|nr:TetR/AcrR family transcriptional regulator [Myxococcota bacterium]
MAQLKERPKERPKGRQSAEVARRTRRTILETAGRHFAARGFRAASLREIAADARTTHGLIRHHFGTKDDLWRAVVKDFVDRVAERQRPLLERPDDGDPLALLQAIATAYMRQASEMPEVSRLILMESTEPGPRLDFLVEHILPLHLAIGPIFEGAREAGHLEEHDADSFFLFLVMLGSVPFTLPDFTNRFSRLDIRTEEGIEAHIRRVLVTLFGTARVDVGER